MNPFFDISEKGELPEDALALKNLGSQRAWITSGRRGSDFWGTPDTPGKTIYRNTTDEDYDQQFVYKLYRWKPIYNIDQVIEYHYNYYLVNNKPQNDFLKHMRYVILPILKKKPNSEVCTQLFEQWLQDKETESKAQPVTIANLSPQPGTISKTVHRIHFDDLSWSDFERLIFTYVKRLRSWETLDWLGQAGHDEGQDIWGESHGETYCYLCANYQALTLKKGKDDINKLVVANAIPNNLIIVCGGKVAASINKGIKSYGLGIGVNTVEVWSGADIEENIRIHAPELLQRFFEGNSFPETESDIWDDARIIKNILDCFNRPAFATPFYREVNIPHFGKAITDTIEVLNTGMHRLRDGTLIKQIPSRHQLRNVSLRNEVTALYDLLIKLRDTFVDLCRKKEIENCRCGDADCPTYILSDNACQNMDNIRQQIFNTIRKIKPDYNLRLHE
ncbi:MAG: hypothetical protein ACTHJ8_00760 [Mucilaginibacter sp.]